MRSGWAHLIDCHLADAQTATRAADEHAAAGDYEESNAAAETAARHRWAADYALAVAHAHLDGVEQAAAGQASDATLKPAWTVHQ